MYQIYEILAYRNDSVSHSHTKRDKPPHFVAKLRAVALRILVITSKEAADPDPKVPSSDGVMQSADSVKIKVLRNFCIVRAKIQGVGYIYSC